MEFEFDKEIDAILRQAGGGESAAGGALKDHLDADEIAIFAENALPDKSRPRVIKHLADCGRCRTILSNTVALNSEAVEEAASSVVSPTEKEVAAIPEAPWYRRLFATQNLAYGLGALALIFAGMIGFIVVQNVLGPSDSEVAQVSDEGLAANSERLAQDSEKPTDANVAVPDSSPEAESKDQSAADKSEAPEERQTRDNKGSTVANGPNAGEDDRVDLKDRAPGAKADDRRESNEKASEPAPAKRSDEQLAKNEQVVSEEKKELSDTEADRDVARAPKPPPVTAEAKKPKARSTPKTGKLSAGRTANKLNAKKKVRERPSVGAAVDKTGRGGYVAGTRKVGGKTFVKRDNIWYDTQYKNQRTTNVKRASSQYKKLDSGLRSITDKIPGTVVLIWKSKAYRIQ